jgi:hypothetical protein
MVYQRNHGLGRRSAARSCGRIRRAGAGRSAAGAAVRAQFQRNPHMTVFCKGLSALLTSLPEATVVGEAADGELDQAVSGVRYRLRLVR